MKLSLLITFFNEEEMILKTHEKMTEQLEKLVGTYIDDYELLYINDGSTDKTFQLMKDIADKNHHVKYISLSRNFGREGGILAGFKYATGDAVMVMDGDLQHPPQLIPIFLDAYFEGYDLVSGQRDRVGESKLGSLFAKLFYQVSNRFMDVKLTDGKSELKLLSRRAVETFIALPEYNRFNKGLYEWIGFKEKVIPYKNQIREVGVSKFGFRKSFNYAIQGIISFNDKPLRICIQLGGLSIILALIYLATEFLKYFSNVEGYVSGYFTTIAAIILFGGVQLISIGILGEYIGKIYYEVKRRPHFVVDDSNIEKAKEDRIG
ncbi:TPA: glycosyltransferase family 2 protein [Streptococcus suis]|uniref:glycosyltransferase PgfS n=1 Tax=Streptococcus suis TaxID=1307 RepID=UPI001ABE780A|nr:glycosyltransferase family 2 protein [Streptococcus suis]MBO4110344.1 glycosyltransferase family 2 protein [Streptococcus suis]HEM3667855.1 glycosyltransferase family 2 protein [Streptococcus suis]HEM3705205.1 glycosyltransferase family 2 protein [Streptococcus suis]